MRCTTLMREKGVNWMRKISFYKIEKAESPEIE